MYLNVSPYQELLEGMMVALEVNEGIIKLTGRAGAGKTALCHELARQLEARGQRVLFFQKPPQSPVKLQESILDYLHLSVAGNFNKQLTKFLLGNKGSQRLLYIIFDEVQDIDVQTFDGIRMLCNVQDDRQSLIKPIVSAAPALDRKLSDITFRSVAQYVSQSFTLPPLTLEQLRDFYWAYWKHRKLEVQPPTEGVIAALFKQSQGFPGPVLAKLELAHERVINRREGRDEQAPAAQLKPRMKERPQVRAESQLQAESLPQAEPQPNPELASPSQVQPQPDVQPQPEAPPPPEAQPQAQPETDDLLARPVPSRRKSAEVWLGLCFGGLLLTVGGGLYYFYQQAGQPATRSVVQRPAAVAPAVVADAQNTTVPSPAPVLPEAATIQTAEMAADAPAVAQEPEVVAQDEALAEPRADVAVVADIGSDSPQPGPADDAPSAAVDASSDAAGVIEADEADVADVAPAVVEEEAASVLAEEPPAEDPAVEFAAEEPADELAAEPGAEPAASEPPHVFLLGSWIASWQAQDVDAYLAHYASDFEPVTGDSLVDWQAQRRRSIGRASDIRITYDNLSLQAEDDSTMTLQFWLHYSASNYADDTLKELVLLKTPEGLRIRNERNLLVEQPQ